MQPPSPPCSLTAGWSGSRRSGSLRAEVGEGAVDMSEDSTVYNVL